MVEVYGENMADEELSQAATVAVLRLQNPDTARWAAQLIGQCEVVQLSHSTNADEQASETASLTVKDATLASEILRLPTAGPENGLQGFFLSPAIGVWPAVIPWDEVMAARAPVKESEVENYVRRLSDPNEPLAPWDDVELAELGISRADLTNEKEVEAPEELQPQPSPEEEAHLEELAREQWEEEEGGRGGRAR
jgi:hypothetical protein